MKPVFPILLVIAVSCSAQARQIVIASKKFTESYVLGEIAKRTLVNAGFAAELRQGMGGTIILWQALLQGEISLYPEYTGTIAFPDPYRNVERLLPPRNQVSRKLSAAHHENRKPTRRRARKEPIYDDHRV
jgi:glycine betaine/choline ABC-type transport system substrate-binding protein